jgi:hypothetical protein
MLKLRVTMRLLLLLLPAPALGCNKKRIDENKKNKSGLGLIRPSTKSTGFDRPPTQSTGRDSRGLNPPGLKHARRHAAALGEQSVLIKDPSTSYKRRRAEALQPQVGGLGIRLV